MSLTNTTVTGNSSPSGGGIRRDGGLTTLTNTTIANNASGGDCSGAMTSLGHNLDGDGSCSLSVASGDLPSTDPLLGPLANNGGPTFTHALLDGSPAIDSGDDSVLDPPHNLFTDQRGPGFPRLQRAHVDIGAYEAEVFSVPIGHLTFVEVQRDGVGGVDGLDGTFSVTVSLDGKHLYATSINDDAVAVFRRNSATGGLTFVEVHGLGRARSVTVSPDGKHLYAARLFDDAVAVFRRNSTTGALTFMEAHKDGVGGVDGVVDGGLDSFGHGPADTPVYFARSVEVSPDGKYLYAAAFNAFDTVAVFRRNSTTGALSFVEVQKDGVGGVDGLGDVRSMTVSPDGKHLYVAGNRDDAVAVFSVASANLSVSKSVDEPSPQEGERVTFTVTVTHNGPRAATGVVVSDVIPSGLTLQSATPSDGAYSTGSGDWTLASSLASGATATLMLVTVVDAGTAGSTITNVATVTASDQADPDAGDSATVTVPPLHTCNGLPATIVGSPGPDHIVGTPGDDVIVALGWDDTVLGLEGNDTICLGDGDDFGDGGPGRDRIFGEDGDDDIRGGGSRDRLYGGRGEDVLRGGRGNDRLYGARHDDVLKGGDGRDRLFGQKGNDVLLGGDGYDLLVGARGDDVLLGRAGDDSHDCGPGLDFANGGDGTDTATGDCESTSAIP